MTLLIALLLMQLTGNDGFFTHIAVVLLWCLHLLFHGSR